jgi:hypothetical protein
VDDTGVENAFGSALKLKAAALAFILVISDGVIARIGWAAGVAGSSLTGDALSPTFLGETGSLATTVVALDASEAASLSVTRVEALEIWDESELCDLAGAGGLMSRDHAAILSR